MAADLHIHVMTDDVTEEVLAEFFASNFGSKWFNMDRGQGEEWSRACDIIANTPAVHVGEVSWLKASLFGDSDTYVPTPVAQISEIIGEDLPVIDDALIDKIRQALRAPNTTQYDISSENVIISFLEEHKGKKAFTVSW